MENKDPKDHPDLMEKLDQKERKENQDLTVFQDPLDVLAQTDRTV